MRSVLVLRRHDRFSEVLEENGFTVVNLELIRTEPLADQTELRSALGGSVRYDGFFVTSASAAQIIAKCLHDLDREHTGMIYVLGERSRRILEDAGINVEFCASANTAEELMNEFGEVEFAGKRFCFVRGDRSMRTIPMLLNDIAAVDEIIVYRTIDSVPDAETVEMVKTSIKNSRFDWACFFSPSAIDAFGKLFERHITPELNAAVIGETSAERGREVGLNVAFVSPHAGSEVFARSFVEQVNEH